MGRVHRGILKEGMNVSLAKRDGSIVKSEIKELHTFEGMGRVKVQAVSSGDICALVGIEAVSYTHLDVYKRQLPAVAMAL